MWVGLHIKYPIFLSSDFNEFPLQIFEI